MHEKYNVFENVADESSEEENDEDDDSSKEWNDDDSEQDSVIRNWSPKDVDPNNNWDWSLHTRES